MKVKRYLLLTIIISIGMISGCDLLSDASQSSQEDGILFQDDFSDASGNWDQVRIEGEGITDYENGAYRIRVDTVDTDVWANPEGQSFTNVRIDVEATKQAGSVDNNDFGILCRYLDEQNFYFFIISSDGYYAIGKVKNGDQELISGENMIPHEAILLGDATNQIRAECDQEKLALYINGQKVDSQTDADFTEGNVGLIAGTFSEVYVDVFFDNFVVTTP